MSPPFYSIYLSFIPTLLFFHFFLNKIKVSKEKEDKYMKRNTINLFLALVTILGTQAITSMSLMGMHQPTLMHNQK